MEHMHQQHSRPAWWSGVGLAIALAACGGGSGEDAGDGSSSGQPVTISAGADQAAIAGSTLSVPAGATSDSTNITLSAQPASARAATPQAAVESEPAIHLGVTEYGMAHLDEGLMHPLYGPVLALGRAQFAGPGIELGPDGLVFSRPVTLRIPLSVLGIGDAAGGLPLLRGRDGRWEVPENFTIDAAAGVATIELEHFSLLQWLRNSVFVPQQTAAIYATGAVQAALARLRQDNLQRFAKSALCSGQSPVANLDAIPPLPDLLDYLGFEQGALSTGHETALRQWIQVRHTEARAGQRQFNSITLERLFERSLQLTGGDVFRALVTAHNTLRDNRNLGSVQDMIENYRGDGGDERGARYHFFGMALYSFAYEHFQLKAQRLGYGGAQLVIGATMKPETVATVEEGVVSGDLVSDITEYAVDLQGAKLGRELFHRVRDLAPAALASSFGLDPAQCGGIRFAPGFTGLNFDGSTVFSPDNADIQLTGSTEDPSIAWRGAPAIGVGVADLTGVRQPGDVPVQLFCIRAREDAQTGTDIPFSSPVEYGVLSTGAYEPCIGQAAAAPPLRSGGTYQILVGIDGRNATILFTLQ